MLRLLILILILVIGVGFGLTVDSEHGLLLIVYKGKSYEMALWFGGLLLILFFFIFYYTLRFLSGFFNLKKWLSDVVEQRRVKQAHIKTNQGLIAFANGQWANAEKKLLAGLLCNENPFINYLFLARVAQAQDAIERREYYLDLARKLGNIELAEKMLDKDESHHKRVSNSID